MNVVFSTGRPAHVALPANLLVAQDAGVTIYTAAYRSRFRGLSPKARLRWTPQVTAIFHFLTRTQLPRTWQRLDTVAYDRMVALRLGMLPAGTFDIFWGWATGSLDSGRAARRLGARFVLDRACPHVDAQQALVREESERLGVPYPLEPDWFRERQLAEYEEADRILVPSEYSRRSFPQAMQAKVLVAPLFGRIPPVRSAVARTRDASVPFTFGFVGGQPLRKGLRTLLEAWEIAALPDSRLLLRTGARLENYPALCERLSRLQNVEPVGYVRDMSEFYRQCDAFVLPTLDDGFGMALVEAMAHGLPAITTDCCGAAELFMPGRDLLMVPAGNAEALAASMRRVFESAALRQELGANAVRAVDALGAEGAYRRYAATLDRVLEMVH